MHSTRHEAIATLVVALALLAAAGTVRAEHEADHRYTVRGYVLDGQRRALPGQRVSIRQFASTTTDGDGEYSIRLHLHNADLGRELQIVSGGVEHTIRVSFDVDDAHTPRVFHANFIDGAFVAGELDRGGTPLWAIAAGGAIAVATGSVIALRRRGARAPRRAGTTPHPTKRRGAKARRRKRQR